VSQYVETMAPGTCFSSRRAMFDAISDTSAGQPPFVLVADERNV
jgi:hypothetical protein